MPQYNEYDPITAAVIDTDDLVLWEVDGVTKKMTTAELKLLLSIIVIEDVSGTTYTLLVADQGKIKRLTNASAKTLTVPATSGFILNAPIVIRNHGAADITFAGDTGVTLNTTETTIPQYGAAAFVPIATDVYDVYIGGGTGTVAIPTLNVPGSFAAVAINDDEIDLSWADTNTSPNESGIEIQRGIASDYSDAVTIDTVTGTNSYNDTVLLPSTTYYYRIRAVGDGVTSITSAWVTANATTDAAGGGISDPDADAYIAALNAVGETVSSGRQTALQTFFAGLNSNGVKPLITGPSFIPLWSTDAADRIDIYGRTNWTNVGATYSPSTSGLTGNNSDYSGTNINANTMLQDDVSLGWFCLSTTKVQPFESPLGCNDGTNFFKLLYGSGTVYCNLNSPQAVTASAALARGFDVADRPDSTHEKFVRNGTVHTSTTVSSVAQTNKEMTVMAEKNQFNAGSNPTSMTAGFFYFGKSMEAAGKSAIFSTLVNDLMTAFGV